MRALLHKGQLAGHEAVVVGAAVSGVAAARLLAYLGAGVRLLDRNPEALAPEVLAELEASGVTVLLGAHKKEQFRGAQMVVLSPGVPVAKLVEFLKACPDAQVLSELELASWFCDAPILAVTGTNGKTTTTSLIGHILESAGRRVFVGGNIGTPLSDHVLSGEPCDVAVLEVSSFQLQNVKSFKPTVAVLLNFSGNHLDFHADMEEYLQAKLQCFARMDAKGLAILPLEMRAELEKRSFTGARKVYFTASNRFPENNLPGAHNRSNMEAAWLACKALGVTDDEVRRGVASFRPLGHRIETVGEKGGVLFVDDSKATTVEAMRAAVESFERPVRLLAGGVFKGGDLSILEPHFGTRIAAVGLFGASREVFEGAWAGKVPLFWAEDLDKAVTRLYREAAPGDVILLSPATASFDQYSGYKARGEHFQRIFESLPDEREARQ
ncbi:UDP-N-acetylmuramoylalanine--D-glutamate ligase [Fundidesulfovibrio magnetotacticus]|uniref:UDP-N-acetylmuramoylalanine--D-glutamate ligase n=1 Tax=Fundidesulfovibrio magnetotacticus TaxID=2730080 RepID=A0A6V8LLJ3_9BACT|nr:UDP-N-acetylmuramoyl-L-alanine--D-glutamate ligase [Fundidesulfovibrio magnetotacticus]GFK93553.1 UDP-N-acetylmuramoylalanine--D-glutamate ligase [Fundidesulfovibrio magnetotacticus]